MIHFKTHTRNIHSYVMHFEHHLWVEMEEKWRRSTILSMCQVLQEKNAGYEHDAEKLTKLGNLGT